MLVHADVTQTNRYIHGFGIWKEEVYVVFFYFLHKQKAWQGSGAYFNMPTVAACKHAITENDEANGTINVIPQCWTLKIREKSKLHCCSSERGKLVARGSVTNHTPMQLCFICTPNNCKSKVGQQQTGSVPAV